MKTEDENQIEERADTIYDEDKIKELVETHHKLVLKLDKNFHVYVHGKKSENIKFEEDGNGKYLKLYYNELN